MESTTPATVHRAYAVAETVDPLPLVSKEKTDQHHTHSFMYLLRQQGTEAFEASYVSMNILPLIFLVLAFCCFVIAAFWNSVTPRVNLIAAGLASWVLSLLLSGVHLR